MQRPWKEGRKILILVAGLANACSVSPAPATPPPAAEATPAPEPAPPVPAPLPVSRPLVDADGRPAVGNVVFRGVGVVDVAE